jgi:hypothetical protein
MSDEKRSAAVHTNGVNGPAQGKDPLNAISSTGSVWSHGGGPRTPAGKKVSSRNSTRHGITSISPVAGGESEEEWLAFLAGIRAALKPVGALEEEIVYNIAIALWQKRRIVRATSGYIDTRLEYVEQHLTSDSKSSAELALERRGIDINESLDVFEAIDGSVEGALSEDLFEDTWVVLQMCPLNKAKREDVARILPAEFSSDLASLRSLAEALAKLNLVSTKGLLKSATDWAEQIAGRIHRRQRRSEALLRAASVPLPQEMDHLIRYEAHYNRSIGKDLQHLELLQRFRTGEDVPAPTRIQIESDLPHAVGE